MVKTFAAAIVCTVFALSAQAPAHALPMPAVTRVAADDIVVVQYDDGYDQGYGKRHRRSYNQRNYGERHYSWCEDHYRSYERDSNSYWAYGGRERQCRSPYM